MTSTFPPCWQHVMFTSISGQDVQQQLLIGLTQPNRTANSIVQAKQQQGVCSHFTLCHLQISVSMFSLCISTIAAHNPITYMAAL